LERKAREDVRKLEENLKNFKENQENSNNYQDFQIKITELEEKDKKSQGILKSLEEKILELNTEVKVKQGKIVLLEGEKRKFINDAREIEEELKELRKENFEMTRKMEEYLINISYLIK
jgi:seryl-tRNA synthetase